MKLSQVAAQLYTCRDLLRTPTDIAKTLTRLRQVGYTAVQVSGLGPISSQELAHILFDTGMVCCATHEPAKAILDAPDIVIDRLQTLRCKNAAYPFPDRIDFSSRKSVDALIANLQRSGEAFARAGMILSYHNHNHEFRTLDGRPILERIYAGTTAEALKAELDTYWIQYGGGDIVAWCRRMAGRLQLMHLKDYQTSPENIPLWGEVGAGVLDFKSIIAAAEESGCQWFAVEQDTTPGDPVEALAASFRYIAEYLAE